MNKNDSAFASFLDELKRKLAATNLPVKELAYNTLSNGVINFSFRELQIGRIYFGKRSSKMQIIDSDNVEWIENRPIDEYISNIDKWISYTKLLEAQRLTEESELEELGLK